jgi:hypothetical protein
VTPGDANLEVEITLCEDVPVFVELDGERVELCRVVINRADLRPDWTVADLVARELLRVARVVAAGNES